MPLGAIHHERGCGLEEGPESTFGVGRQFRFRESPVHHLDPTIARSLCDSKRGVPHPQARVASIVDISLRTAKAKYQEIAKALFRPLQVVYRVHGAEDVVARHLAIKRCHQTGKSFLSDSRVYVLVFHEPMLPYSIEHDPESHDTRPNQ